MNNTVKTLSVISLCLSGVYLLGYSLVLFLQKIYMYGELKDDFYFPLFSTIYIIIAEGALIALNIYLIKKKFNKSNCNVPVILSGVGFLIFYILKYIVNAADVLSSRIEGVNFIAGISSVIEKANFLNIFILTAVILTLISSSINCYHYKTFKENE